MKNSRTSNYGEGENGEVIKTLFDEHNRDNQFGVPEVDSAELQVPVSDFNLGAGKKSSTIVALWNGKRIALKINYKKEVKKKLSYNEIYVDNSLKPLQGTLIPRLLFVSRDKESGARILGLELGVPLNGNALADQEREPNEEGKIILRRLQTINDQIKEYGWMQREASLRFDNAVTMGMQEGNPRLVLIDLESFVPSRYSNLKTCLRTSAGRLEPSWREQPVKHFKTLHRIPIVDQKHVIGFDLGDEEGHEWKNFNALKPAFWIQNGSVRPRLVSLLNFFDSKANFKCHMERHSALLNAGKEALIPRHLFVFRDGVGNVIFGIERVQHQNIVTESLAVRVLARINKDLSTFNLEAPYVHHAFDGRCVIPDLSKLISLDPDAKNERFQSPERKKSGRGTKNYCIAPKKGHA